MKYALIGCGRVSPSHVNAAVNNGFEIAAVCDIRDGNIDDMFARSVMPAEEAAKVRRFADYREMVREVRPELVSIALPSGLTTIESSVFSGCSSLQSLDVSGFDTSKVTDMMAMFSSRNLTELDLSSFDTSKVTKMNWMFSSNLRSLTLGENFKNVPGTICRYTHYILLLSNSFKKIILEISNFIKFNFIIIILIIILGICSFL